MPNYPKKPVDGQHIVEEVDDQHVIIWTYNAELNQWTYHKYGPGEVTTSDELVLIKSGGNQHELNLKQQQVNTQQAEANEAFNTRVTALAAAQTNLTQNLEQAQGTKSRGIWQHHSGPLSGEGAPDENRFWMADEEGNKTQEFCEVKAVRISNVGLGEGGGENVYLGKAEIDDQLLIQNQKSLDGCSYVILSVEEKEGYAIYGVEPDNTFCRGGVAPGEVCVVKLKKPVGTFELEGDFLPLSGGSIAGNLSVSGSLSNQGGIMMAGPRDKGFYVYDLQGGAVFSAYGDKYGAGVQYFGAVEQANHVATKEYVDGQIGGIEIPEASLSTKDKLYLQGFYPFRLGESTQINNPGEFLVKDSSYLVTQDPEKWKYFYFSTTDAYGQDLAGQFLNHMHTESQHEGQVWIAKENGYKLCSYIGKMKVRDQNFEQYFNLEMDNTRELLNPPHYDTQPLRVDKGEVFWIKCSFWG